MAVVELRDRDEASRLLMQGLWLQRVARPDATRVRSCLEWSLEILSNGDPLPPIGFVADLGHLAFGADTVTRDRTQLIAANWPSTLLRSYEDHVLGKFYADWTFERATDALRRYQGRDRAKALAYLIKQFRERTQFGGTDMPPGIMRSLLQLNPDTLLTEGLESLEQDGPHPILLQQYESLISSTRRMSEFLGPEDILALEQKTAIADMGQYVAHRQILRFTELLEARLPHRPVTPLQGRREVPTRVLNEDQYPVGGYSSISNRGSIESLLHSQLAYMEPAEGKAHEPDLFDVKFVRDELFYYSRDENQFLRRRRVFVFIFHSDLIATRFKDPELPTQRIVLLLATVLATIHKLSDWMSTDALHFELLFVRNGSRRPLADEIALLEILLLVLRERGVVSLNEIASESAALEHCENLARNSQVQVLVMRTKQKPCEVDGAIVTQFIVNGPEPELLDATGITCITDIEGSHLDHWYERLLKLLQLWV